MLVAHERFCPFSVVKIEFLAVFARFCVVLMELDCFKFFLVAHGVVHKTPVAHKNVSRICIYKKLKILPRNFHSKH